MRVIVVALEAVVAGQFRGVAFHATGTMDRIQAERGMGRVVGVGHPIRQEKIRLAQRRLLVLDSVTGFAAIVGTAAKGPRLNVTAEQRDMGTMREFRKFGLCRE